MCCAGFTAVTRVQSLPHLACPTLLAKRCRRRPHLAISPINPAVPDRVREHPLVNGMPRVGLRGTLITLGLLIVIGWSWNGTQVSIGELITSAPNMWNLITRMMPPNWGFFTSYDHVI